jgi:DNA repair protein RadA/Sms
VKDKKSTHFVCQLCGYQSSKWLGKCPGCDAWDSLLEEKRRDGAAPAANIWLQRDAEGAALQPLDRIQMSDNARILTGVGEFDRVLGGGVVSGSVVLIGGDPGIGKSTLLLQALNMMASPDQKVLYVSGEESARQIKIRAERLNTLSPHVYIMAENCLETILPEAVALAPKVLVIDSIQTVYSSELQSAPGSVAQVRETSARLIVLSKNREITTFLIGHVTKDGAIAGPRVLEHMVDTVLYFEGDRGHPYRILRAVKNRFGSSNEIGVFEMKDHGLAEVLNPSELFLSQRPVDVSGSVVVPCMEGTRPLLVEIQALVSATNLAMPRRTAIGIDSQRLSLLAAVLERYLSIALYNKDIFLNVTGGVKVEEPAVDLGIAAAIASSALNRSIDTGTIFLGEVGLTGEVRGITQLELRLKEAAKLGFRHGVVPEVNRAQVRGNLPMGVTGVSSLKEVLRIIA